ncbi:unnamed protein product [Adineta steineri]|uniref:F-box domain-containing protein n=1 Tax=Adineta steineri TaxID=433720 RepID=A0A815P173_9BILA|nr:unnamed protein product [Adineta steineri]CAF3873550.1 unnamed protein product [Adineta steineri]
MGIEIRLENLPNEILFETFGYLHALDMFSAFGSLNKRISSIFQSTPLHIIISKIHCRNQVDFLSSYLTFHVHQVISVKIDDKIRDDTSIINLLFNRHDFINLQFCKLITIHHSTKLDNVIEQIKTFDKLLSFNICNLNDITMNENDKYELARIMLMHQPSSLRSIILQYPYNCSNILNTISLSSNITSLYLYINGSSLFASVNSVLPYKSKHFFPMDLLDGYAWQAMLELYVPYLLKFEFHMSIWKYCPRIDLNIVVNSFKYFVTKYSNWHMIIDQWSLLHSIPVEFIMLRTLNYHKHKSNISTNMPLIPSGSFNTQSTMENIDDHYLFYKNEKDLRLYITSGRPDITYFSPLFQQIEFFKLEISKIPSTWLNNFLNIVNFHETSDDNAEEIVSYLSNWIYLAKECSNLINLTILTELLIYSKFIDNSFLIPVFKRIELIETTFEDIYFPASFSMKFVYRFPSLAYIELQVISFNDCVFIIDTFLSHLKNLSYLKIDYFENSLLDDPFSLENIIEKRRQAFPMNIIHEQLVNVKNDGEVIEIWLK